MFFLLAIQEYICLGIGAPEKLKSRLRYNISRSLEAQFDIIDEVFPIKLIVFEWLRVPRDIISC